MRRTKWLSAFLLSLAAVQTADAQTVGATTTLAPVVGRLATPASGQSNIGLRAADLGHVFEHEGSLRILFGDSWADDAQTPIGSVGDDAQGSMAILSGDAVDAYVNAHPPGPGELSWQREAPPVKFRTNVFGLVAPQVVHRNGSLLDMSVFRAPITAFSNEKTGAASAAFTIFHRMVATQCASSTCPAGLTCDRGLGTCFPFMGESAVPCVLGTTRCACVAVAVAGGGMCVDSTNSMHDAETEDGRVLSVAMRMEVGSAHPTVHEQYAVKPWHTSRFMNVAARTVNDFRASRAYGVGNDYRPADGRGSIKNEKVLLFGRPGFAAVGANGQQAKLYFAYVDMPVYSASGSFAWAPKYFTGLNRRGVPQFSAHQDLAVPLDLSGGRDRAAEVNDLVGLMDVSWVGAPVNKWVMFYGGDLPPRALSYWLGPSWRKALRHPRGAIQARFASHPWGPWSAPVDVLVGGDPNAVEPGGQYASGGILFHPACRVDCAPGEPSLASRGNPQLVPDEYGRLYAPKIVDAWTTARTGGADVHWNVSTWNPYQVVLMKTRIHSR